VRSIEQHSKRFWMLDCSEATFRDTLRKQLHQQQQQQRFYNNNNSTAVCFSVGLNQAAKNPSITANQIAVFSKRNFD